MASVFQNLYAEGYPDEELREMTEGELLDYPQRLASYRRYSDPRYYKGVEYADIIESLARRRCAEAFSNPANPPERIFVNVQPLSGAPANNAVYTALLNPGDTILGMNLLHGGHLTHGSSVNRSGKVYKAIHYAVNPQTEQIDYEAVQSLANEPPQDHHRLLLFLGSGLANLPLHRRFGGRDAPSVFLTSPGCWPPGGPLPGGRGSRGHLHHP
jgi:glycine hydroxymethyltransferase